MFLCRGWKCEGVMGMVVDWRAGHASARVWCGRGLACGARSALSRRNRITGFCRMLRIAWGCAQRTTLALDVGHGLAAVVARPTFKR